jgi:AraC-like DNA-binding protein
MVGVEIEPLENQPLQLEMTMRRSPAVRIGTMRSDALRITRPPELMADNEEIFTLVTELAGTLHASLRERSVTLGAGDAVLMHSTDKFVTTNRESLIVGVGVPRANLAPLVANLDDTVMHMIPANDEAVRLLRIYLRSVCEEMPLRSPELRNLVEIHIHDLIALAIGATRDGTALAESRGLSAARLAAVKADILANLGRRDLSLASLARRHGLSERHIRRLFAAEDTSFSDFVLEQRLLRAYRMLMDSRFTHRPISAVAYECGFGDLSYFNRCFRRRFGASPTQYRR